MLQTRRTHSLMRSNAELWMMQISIWENKKRKPIYRVILNARSQRQQHQAYFLSCTYMHTHTRRTPLPNRNRNSHHFNVSCERAMCSFGTNNTRRKNREIGEPLSGNKSGQECVYSMCLTYYAWTGKVCARLKRDHIRNDVFAFCLVTRR